MKFKHNKRRNTAFLYEILVKELTRTTIKNDAKKKQIIVQTIKEFFNKKFLCLWFAFEINLIFFFELFILSDMIFFTF